jgi:hypothetical protein
VGLNDEITLFENFFTVLSVIIGKIKYKITYSIIGKRKRSHSHLLGNATKEEIEAMAI